MCLLAYNARSWHSSAVVQSTGITSNHGDPADAQCMQMKPCMLSPVRPPAAYLAQHRSQQLALARPLRPQELCTNNQRQTACSSASGGTDAT